MKTMIKASLVVGLLASLASVNLQAKDSDLNIIDNVKLKGEIRTRYERVDTDNGVEANALTNRLQLGVAADLLGTQWLSAYAELTNVSALNNNYNDTYADNGVEGNQVVADPSQTRITQNYLDFKYGKTKFRAGRQLMVLDNQRFIGAVGWRQMPQTFDAYTVTDSTVKGLNLFASYITSVNRIFHEDDTKGNFDTRSLLLNASYQVMPELKVTAYSYMIGEGTSGASDTYGLSLTGKLPVSDGLTLNYRAEYAMQDDPSMENAGLASNSNVQVDAEYYKLEAGIAANGILGGLAYELLSGQDTGGKTAFSTPLATLHGHNGWADKFLSTPTSGLVDTSIMLGYKSKKLGLFKAIYHDYSSEVGSIDYGTEINAVYKTKVPGVKKLGLLLKVADYRGGDSVAQGNDSSRATDVTKFWAMISYKFQSK